MAVIAFNVDNRSFAEQKADDFASHQTASGARSVAGILLILGKRFTLGYATKPS